MQRVRRLGRARDLRFALPVEDPRRCTAREIAQRLQRGTLTRALRLLRRAL